MSFYNSIMSNILNASNSSNLFNNISNQTITTNSTNYTTYSPNNLHEKMDLVGFFFTISCSILFIFILIFSVVFQNCRRSKCCIKKNVYYFDKFDTKDENYYKPLDYNSNPTVNKIIKAKIVECDV